VATGQLGMAVPPLLVVLPVMTSAAEAELTQTSKADNDRLTGIFLLILRAVFITIDFMALGCFNWLRYLQQLFSTTSELQQTHLISAEFIYAGFS
jgi:hypothetical protein